MIRERPFYSRDSGIRAVINAMIMPILSLFSGFVNSVNELGKLVANDELMVRTPRKGFREVLLVKFWGSVLIRSRRTVFLKENHHLVLSTDDTVNDSLRDTPQAYKRFFQTKVLI